MSQRLSYQGRKNSFQASQEAALQQKIREQDIVRTAELRKFRREQLLQRQNLEKILLTEVRMIIVYCLIAVLQQSFGDGS